MSNFRTSTGRSEKGWLERNSQKKDQRTSKHKNLGTFETRETARKYEQQVEFFKRKK